MGGCDIDAIKLIGKYLNTSVGTVCYSSDMVLTMIMDNQSIEGFSTIVLRLSAKSGVHTSNEQALLSYQWLEHLAMFANQAVVNPAFAKSFLEDFNRALEGNTYLTGHSMSIADVAAYYVLYPMMERLSISEKESLLHVSRWSKHIQSQPKVCAGRPPLLFNTLTLSTLAPAVH